MQQGPRDGKPLEHPAGIGANRFMLVFGEVY